MCRRHQRVRGHLCARPSTGVTERVSVDSAGGEANFHSAFAAVSADGRFVAFNSSATNLVSRDFDGADDVFVHDRQTGTTELASVNSEAAQSGSTSALPAVSVDGRFVAFQSFAANLVADDTNGAGDIFLRDRQEWTTERVSVDSQWNWLASRTHGEAVNGQSTGWEGPDV